MKRRLFLIICSILIVITLAGFWNVLHASFVNMDDGMYVTGNARVKAGLTWGNVKWAFSTTYFGFYYPLTWLSHMLDCQLYGTRAGGHHLTSMVLHLLNVLLLFAAMACMTKAPWRSAAVAALFAVHPLHVESVAWVAERKDVLSTFFWFLGLLAYAWYVEKPSVRRYTLLFSAFLLGLMAKPMLVTFPFTLLLLDYWPLGRWPSLNGGMKRNGGWGNLILEKLPLFALVPLFSFITMSAQKEVRAVISLDAFSMPQRAANALVSYVVYLKKMVVPIDLTAYYPLAPEGVPGGSAVLCGFVIVLLTVAVLWFGPRRKFLVTGWLWYLGTLVPVIGLVQVGEQAMADRYTYVPLIGLFVLIVWGVAELADRNRLVRGIAIYGGAAALIAMVILTRVQAGYWNDSVSLYEHALAVTGDNAFVHNNLGIALREMGKKDEAKFHFMEAVRVNPDHGKAQLNLGCALADDGEYGAAIEHYQQALKNDPNSVETLNDLGEALAREKRLSEAVEIFKRAVEIDPGAYDSNNNLGYALLLSGKAGAATEYFRAALKIDPSSVTTLDKLGQSLAIGDRLPEAIECFKKAVEIDPGFFDSRNNLGYALLLTGRPDEAAEQFREALRIDPGSEKARSNLEKAEKVLKEKNR